MNFIQISDVTLRELQNSNFSLSFKEKLEIAKKIDELNIDFLEIPYSNNKADEVLVKTLSSCLNNTKIAYVIDCDEQKLLLAKKLLATSKNKKIIINIPVSADKMEYSFNVKKSKLFEMYLSIIEKCTNLFDTEVCLDDATRADPMFLYSIIKKAIELNVKCLTISDKTGFVEPNDFKLFIDEIIKNVPEIKNVQLFVECSDKMCMATSSIFNCFTSGVNGVKLSALNISSLPDFESFFTALEYIGSKKGFSSHINKTCLNRVVNQMSSILTTNKKSSLTSNDLPDKDITKKLTISSCNKLLKERGYDLSVEDANKVYEEIVRIGEKKNLTTKDLDSIVAVTALQVPASYSLVNYAVHCSNVLSSSANITLEYNKKQICGIAIGNGAIDSAFLAIQNALGRNFDLDEFVVNSVTEGQQAMGETIIKLRNNGKIYSGRGVSTDIVGASIRAYINALNKIVYEEKE